MRIRTDMAWENKEIWEQSAENRSAHSGIVSSERRCRGLTLKTVEITNEAGQRALGRPKGIYHTLDIDTAEPKTAAEAERISQAIASVLRPLLAGRDHILAVGLGNEAITPDAIGPRTIRHVIVTRHLKTVLGQKLPAFRSVCAAEPGVLGSTGMESAEIVRALVRDLEIQQVIAVDALATAEPGRICRSIQISDTGIEPGSGVGNRRARLSAEVLGVPVVAIGVPTLTDYGRDGLIVIPRDMDEEISRMARLIGCGMDLALHRGIAYSDIPRFLP